MNRHRPLPIGPVHRALAMKKWSATGVEAQIHAILGDNAAELRNLAGRMFFVILGAAITEKVDPEQADIRIVRGAVNALYDQEDDAEITGETRASIISGLEAVKRLTATMQTRSIVDAHFDLMAKLARGVVDVQAFERRIAEVSA